METADLANNVRRLRKAAGLTQAELAERAGMRREQITFLETGRRDPQLKTVEAIAQALALPVANLFATTKANQRKCP